MSSTHYDPVKTPAWARLRECAADADSISICRLFENDSQRHNRYSLSCGGIYLDYSKNLVTDEIRHALIDLARQSPLEQLRQGMFSGDAINVSENRPVLHPALRAGAAELPTELDEQRRAIDLQQRRIREISEKIRSGQWLGATGMPVTDVINIGIGGSDLGPRLACEALREYAITSPRLHFVANVDGEVIRSLLDRLNPATTLVIICSKTFTTQETLLNARHAAGWFRDSLGIENPFASSHFLGVTASPANAEKMGIKKDNLLEFWDWVGGRYSLWSAVGLALAIAIGHANFEDMLRGAAVMDRHFRTAPIHENMPVLMGLLGIWYSNFLSAESCAVIPYCDRLGQLPLYLQQLDMESNGKSVTRDGRPVACDTGPIVWGMAGTNGQHSFFQLLHQGTHLVPVDFIGVLRDAMNIPEHHRVLLANMLAQGAALMTGQSAPVLPSHRVHPGNRPSNTLLLDELNPLNFGALLALYEHKVFVQGCVWNINSFDQWGVEFGKSLAKTLLDRPPPGVAGASMLDSSTEALMGRVIRAADEH